MKPCWSSGGRLVTRVDPADATPAAIMLGLLMIKEQLLELKRKAIEVQQRQLEAGAQPNQLGPV